MRGPGEACDDGNLTPGDGCSEDCRVIELGYRCMTPGMPCVRV
jgi:cysteine-rich repeat protein